MNEMMKEIMQFAKQYKEDNTEPRNESTTLTIDNLMDIDSGLANFDDSAEIEICTYCGNTGKGVHGEIPCPKCKREYKKPTLAVSDLPSYIFVPDRYKNNNWDADKAKENSKITLITKTNKLTPYWIQTLDAILNKAKENMIFSDSYFVCGPDGTGKTIWAFSVMRSLHANNVNVSPLLILNDIDCYGDDVKKYQALFLRVTKMNFSQSIDKLDYIIQKRKMLGLPTFVITSIQLKNFISEVDQSILGFDEVISLL